MRMALFETSLRSGAFVAAAALCLALGGCGAAGGIDLDIDAPALDAIGLNLSSKPKQEEDIPERPGLVMPPANATATLPQPGERTAAIGSQNWPADPDLQKKQKVEADAAAREKYCREGDWSGKGGIVEFDKNVGREARCSSKLGETINKNINKSGRVENSGN
jgi:hypothetical protein